MNYDLALIASILETRNIAPAIKAGVTEDQLTDEGAACWALLKDYVDEFHEVPSVEHFQSFYVGYEHYAPEDSVEAIVGHIRHRNLQAQLNELLVQVSTANEADAWEALGVLTQNMDTLIAANKRDSNDHLLGTEIKEIRSNLERLQKGGGLMGLPWPWEYFNEITAGILPGQVYYFYGREKSRKTFLLHWMALFYWSLGLKVLFVLRDTPLSEMKVRSYALALRLPYLDYLKGRVTDEDLDDMEALAEELRSSGRFIFVDQENGFAGFRAKVEEYNPDIVFHDYPKGIADDEMEGKNPNQESRYVARMADNVKTYAGRKKIPIMMAGHANRMGIKGKGKDSGEMAWSDHIARRVDGAFRVIQDDYNNRMALFVTAGRSMQQKIGITVDSDLCAGFGEYVSADTSWVQVYEEQQAAEEKAKANQSAPGGGMKKAAEDKVDLSRFRKGARGRK